MFRSGYDDSSGSLEPTECDKMTFMTMPKKQKEHRVEPTHGVKPTRTKKAADIERAVAEATAERVAAEQSDDVEENCPVIRANHILFSSGRTGRTRVVFY